MRFPGSSNQARRTNHQARDAGSPIPRFPRLRDTAVLLLAQSLPGRGRVPRVPRFRGPGIPRPSYRTAPPPEGAKNLAPGEVSSIWRTEPGGKHRKKIQPRRGERTRHAISRLLESSKTDKPSGPRCRVPDPSLSEMRDTAVLLLAQSLPGRGRVPQGPSLSGPVIPRFFVSHRTAPGGGKELSPG